MKSYEILVETKPKTKNIRGRTAGAMDFPEKTIIFFHV